MKREKIGGKEKLYTLNHQLSTKILIFAPGQPPMNRPNHHKEREDEIDKFCTRGI